MIQLPVPNTPNTNLTVTLVGVSYVFKYRYNSRNGRLYLSILLSDDVPMVEGLRIVENSTPLLQYSFDEFDKGQLYIFRSKESPNNVVTLGNIGIDSDYWLIYLPKEEWAY